jgi:hypothetical protein
MKPVHRGTDNLGYVILAQTGCDCKFNIEDQKCFCLFMPPAITAARKFMPPAWRVLVDSGAAHATCAAAEWDEVVKSLDIFQSVISARTSRSTIIIQYNYRFPPPRLSRNSQKTHFRTARRSRA